MEDERIIELYWNRSENAIKETDKKYGAYCRYIANNILQNLEDTTECVNDTYLQTWNAIPPTRPNVFKLFIAKITRNLAINRYKKIRAQKRNHTIEIVLEDCIATEANVENNIEYKELVLHLNKFLENLPISKRNIFIDRYWYLNSIEDISLKNEMSQSNVKVILHRLRNDLRKYFNERGIQV